MKKLLLSSAIATVLALFSCKKDIIKGPSSVLLEVKALSASVKTNIIQVSSSQETNEQLVLQILIKPVRNDLAIKIKKLPIVFSSSAGVSNVISSSKIKISDNYSIDYSNFNDINKVIYGDCFIISVLVNYKNITGNYPEGASLQASLQVSNIEAEDMEGNPIGPGNITGEAIGDVLILSTGGVRLTPILENASVIPGEAKNSDTAYFVLIMDPGPFGGDRYMGKNLMYGTTVTGTSSFAWVLEKTTNPNAAVVLQPSMYITYINAANTKQFDKTFQVSDFWSIAIIVKTIVPEPGTYRLRVTQVRTFSDSTATAHPINQDLSFRTRFVSL